MSGLALLRFAFWFQIGCLFLDTLIRLPLPVFLLHGILAGFLAWRIKKWRAEFSDSTPDL
jgi:hypothetical protein